MFPPEDDPRAGQSVNVGSDGFLVPITAQTGLQIVHHDQQDVWSLSWVLRASQREEQAQRLQYKAGQHVVVECQGDTSCIIGLFFLFSKLVCHTD